MDEEGTQLVNGVASNNTYTTYIYQNMIPDLLTQIAYAKIIVELPQNAYACLREPVNINVSASAEST